MENNELEKITQDSTVVTLGTFRITFFIVDGVESLKIITLNDELQLLTEDRKSLLLISNKS